MTPTDRSYTARATDDGVRVDKVLQRIMPEDTRRSWMRDMFERGLVRVQGRPVAKGFRLTRGQVLTVCDSLASARAQPDASAPLHVVLQRDDLVIVDKPAGQPCAPLRPEQVGTVANALLARYPEMARVGYGPLEPGLVHRIDNNTSGLVIAARSNDSFAHLVTALRGEKIDKYYLLICAKQGLATQGVIELPLVKMAKRAVAVRRSGGVEARNISHAKPARTEYRVLRCYGPFALVLVHAPKALRHQIRAHFAAIDHPLVGDVLYGSQQIDLPRHALHAHTIRYEGDSIIAPFQAVSALPEDMENLLKEAEKANQKTEDE